VTNLDDSIAISLFIMVSTGIPFLSVSIPALEKANTGDVALLVELLNSGWPLAMLAIILLCTAIVAVGVIFN